MGTRVQLPLSGQSKKIKFIKMLIIAIEYNV